LSERFRLLLPTFFVELSSVSKNNATGTMAIKVCLNLSLPIQQLEGNLLLSKGQACDHCNEPANDMRHLHFIAPTKNVCINTGKSVKLAGRVSSPIL